MFTKLVGNLSTDERRLLTAAGITNARISEWKTGKSIPTRTQAVMLSAVTGYDFATLEVELAEIETRKDAEKNSLFGRMLETASVRSILGLQEKTPELATAGGLGDWRKRTFTAIEGFISEVSAGLLGKLTSTRMTVHA